MSENKDKVFSNTVINWFPGHMAKTKREIKEKISLIDVIYEIIDARMPISSKISDIDELVGNKPRIIIMTKYDMCDKEETNKLIKYYEDKGNYVIPVDLLKGTNVSNIIKKTKEFADKINLDRKNKGLKPRNIRALVVGVPNCGKSTLINRLVGKKVAQTGDKPGITKSLGWIRIGKDIELLDTPGILWPKFDNQEQAYTLAALSSIKEEIIDIESLSIFILEKMNNLYSDLLLKRYNIDNYSDNVLDYLDLIGTNRKALTKGSMIDYDKVYKIIIKDLKDGAFGNITLDRL